MVGKVFREENNINIEPVSEKFIARKMIVNGTCIRIKSIFLDKIPLEKAFENIVIQKIKQEQ